MKSIFTEKIRRFAHRHTKSKKGSTLIELVATIAILGIVSSISLSALYAMSDIATRGQNISVAQRSSALLSKQFSLYGNTANNIESMAVTHVLDDLLSIGAYPSNTNGFMDADNKTVNPVTGAVTYPYGEYDDYFISASTTAEHTIVFSRFDTTTSPYSFKTITQIDNIESITFSVKELSIPYTDPSKRKYVMEYSITAINAKRDSEGNVGKEYTINGGVVMNNVMAGVGFSTTTISTDPTDSNYTNVVRIRSTSRKGIDRD